MRLFTENNPTDWDLKLPYFVANQNAMNHSSTAFPPFNLMFAREFEIPGSTIKPSNATYTYNDFADEMKAKIKDTWKWAHDNIIKKRNIIKNIIMPKIEPGHWISNQVTAFF